MHSKSLVDFTSFPIFSINTFWNSHGMQNDMNLSAGLHSFLKYPSLCTSSIPVLLGAPRNVWTYLSWIRPILDHFVCWQVGVPRNKTSTRTHVCAVISCRAAVSDDSLEQNSWRAELMFLMTRNETQRYGGRRATLTAACTTPDRCSGTLGDDARRILSGIILRSAWLSRETQPGLSQDLLHPWLPGTKCQ